MFPLTPALSLKGEGGVRAGIILWGTLNPRGEGRGGGHQRERFPSGTTSGVPATGSSIIMQRMP